MVMFKLVFDTKETRIRVILSGNRPNCDGLSLLTKQGAESLGTVSVSSLRTGILDPSTGRYKDQNFTYARHNCGNHRENVLSTKRTRSCAEQFSTTYIR
jgi:hypothetical protein